MTTHKIQVGTVTPSLTDIVEGLCASAHDLTRRRSNGVARPVLPSRQELMDAMELLRIVMFPGYYGPSEVNEENVRYHVGAKLDRVARIMGEQIRRGLCFLCDKHDPNRCGDCESRAVELAKAFLVRLPEVRRLLATDVEAAYEGDPAASSPDETILCYPGILAVTNHRIAHELYRLGVPLLPRMIAEHAHSITGIDIHPGAQIGEKFFIDHGTGVVIGETSIIGNNVRIYQGVTLGAKSFPLDEDGNPIKGIPRHPIVEDDVTIYSGATILGRITLGRGTVVGGNVWVTRSTAPKSKLAQAPARQESFVQGGGI